MRSPWVADPPLRRRSASGTRAAPLAAGLLGIGFATLVGGPLGLLAGALVAGLAWWWLRRLPAAADSRRAAELDHLLPWALELLAGCLDAGAGLADALGAVSEAAGGEPGRLFGRSAALLELGAPFEEAFAGWDDEPGLAGAARALVRSASTGAAVSPALCSLAMRQRRETRGRQQAAVQLLSVHAVAPLGGCLLPAFVLLTVVPVAVGLLARLR
jgi:pilus assembly protein TadC